MKAIKIAKFSTIIWIIGFIAYNAYFGWNKTPLSELEKTFDGVFRLLMIFNIGTYLSPLLNQYEKWIEKQERMDEKKAIQEEHEWFK